MGSNNNDEEIDNILNPIIFALINSSNKIIDKDDDDDEWKPLTIEKPKLKPKRKFTDLKIKNPRPITCLNDLIDVLEKSIYKRSSKKKKILKSKVDDNIKELIDSLKELQDMIGMDDVKDQIVNQILMFYQKMNDKGMFLHTVLTGQPGCGKSTLCNILAKIYKCLGFLETDNIVIADRSKLIGQWLGETSIKTKKVLEEARGGILLIDEAYSLGSKEGRDSFAKECIDCINQYLSENVDELVCIIAGYKDDLDKCFFAQNRGLERRFPWRYNIDQYKPHELCKILKMQASSNDWEFDITDDELTTIIENNINIFQNNGGDTRVFLDKCKIVHARRIFGTLDNKKLLSKNDINDGLKIYKCIKNKVDKEDNKYLNLYI